MDAGGQQGWGAGVDVGTSLSASSSSSLSKVAVDTEGASITADSAGTGSVLGDRDFDMDAAGSS